MEGIVRKTMILFLATGLIVPTLNSCKPKSDITQDELLRRTQELVNSVAVGDQAPWKKYFAEDSMYFDEKGRNMNKAALVADIVPLPAGYSGSIKIARPKFLG
jgi:aromatic ring-opening dioxygenase catalytic subunit (LigB family)